MCILPHPQDKIVDYTVDADASPTISSFSFFFFNLFVNVRNGTTQIPVAELRGNREFKKTTTATATGTLLNKRFNEQKNGCARAL